MGDAQSSHSPAGGGMARENLGGDGLAEGRAGVPERGHELAGGLPVAAPRRRALRACGCQHFFPRARRD